MFDDPEKFGGSVERRGLGKIRRWRIKTLRNVAPWHARRAVADGAMCRVVLDADDDLRRIVELWRHRDTGRLRLDRAGARRFEEPGVAGQCGAVAATS